MTKSETIQKFRLYYDDGSPLSSQEESDLFDKIYQKVCMDRPWEFLRKSYASTQSTTLPYVSLPSDFGFLMPNYNYAGDDYAGEGPVVFIGSQYAPFNIVSIGDRRRYRNQSGYAYVDVANNQITFTQQPTTGNAIEFDYAAVPPNLALNESPIFPARFHDIIYHGMVEEVNMIEMTDKGKSYAPENVTKYQSYLNDMAYWNAELIQL